MGEKEDEKVWIEIEETSPRVRGCIHRSSGTKQHFDGWLELLGALSPDGSGTASSSMGGPD